MESNKQNKKINILITSASRKVSLIKIFKKALKKEKEGMVIALDPYSLSVAFNFSDLSFLSPPISSSNFIPKVLEICRKYKIRLLIPTRDEDLKVFAENKEKFSKIGVIVTVPDLKTIEICFDKLKFAEFCKKNNFPIPTVFTLKETKKRLIKFPLFLNDRFGKGSRSAFKVNNRSELELYLKIVKNPIVQEFIEAKEYTIDLFTDSNKNIISVVPRERIYTFGGESFIGKTNKNKILIESAIKLAQKLNLVFHNNIQCFFDGKNVKFIEVNPRYGGGSNLSFVAGANTPLYLIQLAKGKKVRSKIGKFKNNLILLRYTEDILIEQKIKFKEI
jgi:carbamoyl-phosphate synthase large subunit